jgi:hypothetical protein
VYISIQIWRKRYKILIRIIVWVLSILQKWKINLIQLCNFCFALSILQKWMVKYITRCSCFHMRFNILNSCLECIFNKVAHLFLFSSACWQWEMLIQNLWSFPRVTIICVFSSGNVVKLEIPLHGWFLFVHVSCVNPYKKGKISPVCPR